MKKITLIAMLFGTAAFAQTTTTTPVNPQITDAVTQAQHDELTARVLELESIMDELFRKDQLEHTRAFFAFDSFVANEQSKPVVNELVSFMKDYPAYFLTIEGHADERGTRVYNLSIGERRASWIKQELVKNGIDSNRIQTVSYGKERPAVVGSNEVAWSQNRRTVFVLIK
jgi:peptidoglycan-associated lipoprotein